MTLKRRLPEDEKARAAAIEAFGAGADAPQPVPPPVAPAEPVKPLAPPSAVAPGPKVKPIPIRFTEEDKALLERVALQEGRSQNNLVLHILIPALRALEAEGQ